MNPLIFDLGFRSTSFALARIIAAAVRRVSRRTLRKTQPVFYQEEIHVSH